MTLVFQIFIVAGWMALLILLLYLWADVREMSRMVRELKRELWRIGLGARNGQEGPVVQAVQKKDDPEKDTKDQQSERKSFSGLKPSEEQVLNEVLTEFLG